MTAFNKDPLERVTAKTAKGKRILDSREPKVVEDAKSAVFLRGTKTSTMVNETLSDLYSLKKPNAVMMFKKNPIHPFEGGESTSTLEFFAQRNNASFSLFASHSKKRANNLVLTRMFDGQVMDMIELSILAFKSIQSIAGPTCAVGLKPAFVFNGELWEQKKEYQQLQNMLLDFFRGEIVEEINLGGIESVISVTATEGGIILFRVYRVQLKKSGGSTPLIKLELMGPAIDWKLGRITAASTEMMKEALRKPKELTGKKVKNITTTPLGETLGRVHVGDQKLEKIQTRKLKGLKKRPLEKDSKSEDGKEDVEEDEE